MQQQYALENIGVERPSWFYMFCCYLMRGLEFDEAFNFLIVIFSFSILVSKLSFDIGFMAWIPCSLGIVNATLT